MKTKKIVTGLLITTIFFTFSCSKEGPQGEQGIQGEAGTKGKKGDRGQKGTANVIYSKWIDIDWSYSVSPLSKNMLIPEKRITQSLIDEGTILMYLGLKSDNAIAIILLLPYDLNNDHISFLAGKDFIEKGFTGLLLEVKSIDGTSPVDDDYNEYAQVRYVLIPGGVAARGSSSPPNYNDYHAVCEYYGIPE